MFSLLQRGFSNSFRIAKHCNYLNNGIYTTVIYHKPPADEGNKSKVAVVLSGCGVYDGSEVHESSAVLVHLSRHNADISMFAPDVEQMHTVNHTKGEAMEPNRNVLVESARIARGKIEPLSNLKAENFDAVIFPGGFGAAKNLSSFAEQGTMMKVLPDVERVIKDFHGNNKPIGLCCIAPVLAARLIPGCEVTVGMDKDDDGRWPYSDTAEAIKTMGAKHVLKNVTDYILDWLKFKAFADDKLKESHTDAKNKIVTSPAFMCEGKFHEIFDSVGEMVSNVLKLLK